MSKIAYNIEQAESMLDNIPSLCSIVEIKEWKTNAKKEIANMSQALSLIDNSKSEIENERQASANTFLAKTFISKLLSTNFTLKRFSRKTNLLTIQKNKIEAVKSHLNYWTALIPDDEKEAATMLTQLKKAKLEIETIKELVKTSIKRNRFDERNQYLKKIDQFPFLNTKLLQVQEVDLKIIDQSTKTLHRPIEKIDSRIESINNSINWIEKIQF